LKTAFGSTLVMVHCTAIRLPGLEAQDVALLRLDADRRGVGVDDLARFLGLNLEVDGEMMRRDWANHRGTETQRGNNREDKGKTGE